MSVTETTTTTPEPSNKNFPVSREERQAITALHTRIYVHERSERGIGSMKETARVACGPVACTYERTCANHQRLFESQRPALEKRRATTSAALLKSSATRRWRYEQCEQTNQY
jgi:hypothetical protein